MRKTKNLRAFRPPVVFILALVALALLGGRQVTGESVSTAAQDQEEAAKAPTRSAEPLEKRRELLAEVEPAKASKVVGGGIAKTQMKSSSRLRRERPGKGESHRGSYPGCRDQLTSSRYGHLDNCGCPGKRDG